jgi:hypothetical protein
VGAEAGALTYITNLVNIARLRPSGSSAAAFSRVATEGWCQLESNWALGIIVSVAFSKLSRSIPKPVSAAAGERFKQSARSPRQ